jgi:hypothetical protein
MKTLLRIVLSVIGVIALVVLVAFAIGATLPVEHSVSITGTVAAPPAKVFALITDVANSPKWRPQVKTVEVLPKDNSRDQWVEDYGSGQTMKFLAITTAPVGPNGSAVRKVKTDGKDFGGSWTYELSPGPTANSTTLKITENGYINSAFFRFVMAYISGPTKNLDDYMKALQAAAPKS